MATATNGRSKSKTETNRLPNTKTSSKEKETVNLTPLSVQNIRLRIVGISPLCSNQWTEKAKRMMREKHAGKKTRNREVRDPEAEGKAAIYRTEDGKCGIPAMAIKSAMSTAAHKDIGIAKTTVNKSVFVIYNDSNRVLPLDIDEEPPIVEDCVRPNGGGVDLRYRPYYWPWACEITLQVDRTWLTIEDVVNLLNRAGFGVGVGEMRPENGGENGRFEVDMAYGIKEIG